MGIYGVHLTSNALIHEESSGCMRFLQYVSHTYSVCKMVTECQSAADISYYFSVHNVQLL